MLSYIGASEIKLLYSSQFKVALEQGRDRGNSLNRYGLVTTKKTWKENAYRHPSQQRMR